MPVVSKIEIHSTIGFTRNCLSAKIRGYISIIFGVDLAAVFVWQYNRYKGSSKHRRIKTMRIFRALILASLAVTVSGSALRAETYQLAGTILREDGQPFLHSRAVVFLHGAVKPYFAQTEAASDGKFKFKNVPADTYTLIVALPRMGELQKTIEVGPGFADSKKRVVFTVTAGKAASMEKTQVVSTSELSVPENAKQEYRKAAECLGRGDIQGAVACLKRATEIAPQFASAWNFLGTIAHQGRQFAQAEESSVRLSGRTRDCTPRLLTWAEHCCRKARSRNHSL